MRSRGSHQVPGRAGGVWTAHRPSRRAITRPRNCSRGSANGSGYIVRADVLGSAEEMTLRFDGETFYCDTPTTLHKHDTPEEMVECMRQYGYVSDD